MKMYLISDNIDTLVGLKIAGINGEVLHREEEVLECIERISNRKDIGIIIITEVISKLVPEKINEIKTSKYLPLIVEIPNRHGSSRGDDWILRYIKEAIGLKIWGDIVWLQ